MIDAEERRVIAEELDLTLVVEAAAGTGKTTALVGRILSLLASGRATVESLAAVTFTEKAAGELKLRLRARLEEARQVAQGESRHHLNEALAHLEEARINTIHGFCTELLRERPVEARVDPIFATLTEGQAQRIFAEAFDRWLERVLENPGEGVRRALRRWDLEEPVLDTLRKAARELCDWRDFTARWRRPEWNRPAALERARLALAGLGEVLEKCYNNDSMVRSLAPVVTLNQRLEQARRLGQSDGDGLEAELVRLAGLKGFQDPKRGRSPKIGPGIYREDVQARYQALKRELEQFCRLANQDLAACLQAELWEVVEAYERHKAREGKLDFQDLLLRARDLLRDHAEARADLQGRFTHLFVDEFQDTDPIQAEILLLLAGRDSAQNDWRQVRVRDGKLFLVGDPKQSIYRFRRADVGIYEAVKQRLVADGARLVQLTTNFRSLPSLQHLVNRVFEPLMDGSAATLQASYVPLSPFRAELPGQPTIVALPVGRPYGMRDITKTEVNNSLPDLVANYIRWLVEESGWQVHDEDGQLVKVDPGHICLLFRGLTNWQGDWSGRFARALEARSIPHLLVGGRGFFERAEIMAMVTVLSAIEWPGDRYWLYGALKGPLFALDDAVLLAYGQEFGGLDPFAPPEQPREAFKPVVEALEILGELHRTRNTQPLALTLEVLLERTRAHVGLILRNSGEQALANVLRLVQMARQFELEGGISFRAFVESLHEQMAGSEEGEAPVVEEGSLGVRMMTAHKSKGLEFPVVILVDVTANPGGLAPYRATDPSRNLCAFRLGNYRNCWAPVELEEMADREAAAERSEMVRLAYVAATRARDMLVVPAVGEDGGWDGWWMAPLLQALRPRTGARPEEPPFALPEFGPDTILSRNGDWEGVRQSLTPGFYALEDYNVVWWCPELLAEQVEPGGGLRRRDLVERIDEAQVELDANRYDEWLAERAEQLEVGRRPSRRVRSITRAQAADLEEGGEVEEIWLQADGDEEGPGGPRFGQLVHAVMASLDWQAPQEQVEALVGLHARVLGCPDEELAAATERILAALHHPLLQRARAASELRRESPVTLVLEDGRLMEGILDLAFRDEEGWTVVDFKTDRDLRTARERYRRQVSLYARAVEGATGLKARAVLLAL